MWGRHPKVSHLARFPGLLWPVEGLRICFLVVNSACGVRRHGIALYFPEGFSVCASVATAAPSVPFVLLPAEGRDYHSCRMGCFSTAHVCVSVRDWFGKRTERCCPEKIPCVNTGCFKNTFTTLKAYINLFSVLNSRNVAKHAEFYLGLLSSVWLLLVMQHPVYVQTFMYLNKPLRLTDTYCNHCGLSICAFRLQNVQRS
jgi:hypothetical protein